MMTEKPEEKKDNRKAEDNDIRFLKEKRRSGPNVMLMAALLLAIGVAYALWFRQASQSGFFATQAPPVSAPQEQIAVPRELVDRIWIDSLPQRETDKFNFYLFSSEDNFGINDHAQSIYKHLLEFFYYRATDSALTFQFPHDKRQARCSYKVERLSKPERDIDLKLTIENDPQMGGKTTTYLSSTKWQMTDLETLPPTLRSLPLQSNHPHIAP